MVGRDKACLVSREIVIVKQFIKNTISFTNGVFAPF